MGAGLGALMADTGEEFGGAIGSGVAGGATGKAFFWGVNPVSGFALRPERVKGTDGMYPVVKLITRDGIAPVPVDQLRRLYAEQVAGRDV